jgi:hypothetical protein
MKKMVVFLLLTFLGVSFQTHGAQPAADKLYGLHGRHSNLCLAQGAEPTTIKCRSNDGRSQWTLIAIPSAPSVYMLRNAANGLCLFSHAQINNGALYFDQCNSNWWAAHWQLQAIDTAHYQIKSRHTALCLDSNSDIADGALTRGACNLNYWSQHWQLLPAAIREWSWNPDIASDCHVFNDSAQNGWVRLPNPMSPRCVYNSQLGRPLAWTIGTYNERLYDYLPGPVIPQDKIGPNKVFNFGLYPKSDGTYKIGMAVDKVSNADYLDQYTNGFFSDSFDINYVFARPDLNRNLYADLRIGLMGTSRIPVPQARYNMSRLLLGVTAVENQGLPNQKVYYMEVVFWRDAEYDGCTSTENWWGTHPAWPCDSSNLYDRRSDWGSGEGVYYYAGGLNQVLGYHMPTLSPGGGMMNYRLPITKLFRSYAWQRPIDWSKTTVSGIYMGIEAVGKSRAWYELENYRLYEVGNE